MATTAPTRREIVLIILLLVSVITLSHYSFDFSIQRKITKSVNDDLFQSNDLATNSSKAPHNFRTKLSWATSKVTETRLLAHVPGWTIFDNMYILNGTVYLVSDEPERFPNISAMTSTGDLIENGKEKVMARLPTDKDMRIIGTKEARKIFGNAAEIIDGVTFYANDPYQFVTHYYHFSAELFFGFWRTYSSLDPHIDVNGNTTLAPPRRMMFPHADADHWRDYASMNEWVVRGSFPSLSFEFSDEWRDRIEMGKPFILDRVVFGDRSAAMYGYNFLRTQRSASTPFALPGSVNWWMTIRANVIKLTGLSGTVGEGTTDTPVITYISRQEWVRRMLIQKDHERLVEELYKLRDTYGYEVNVVSMEQLSRIQQLRLAARTTIMMGVHGNGLTSLVWMKPSTRSTVMEFFFPGGFAHDYEFTARALGMVHYGFWNSEYFTSPQVPDVAYPEGFQGNEIPLDGAAVARLCHERLTLSDEADD